MIPHAGSIALYSRSKLIHKVLRYDYKVVVEGIALIHSFAVGKGLILFLYNNRVRG